MENNEDIEVDITEDINTIKSTFKESIEEAYDVAYKRGIYDSVAAILFTASVSYLVWSIL